MQQKEQRKLLSGLGAKPHMLSKQNEVIQRMIDRGSSGPSSIVNASAISKPITSGDPLLATGELKDAIGSAIGGTPKIVRKTGGKRGNSQSRVIEREMELPPQGTKIGNTILQQKN